MEKEQIYRDILEGILAFTNGKHMLRRVDVVRYTGMGKAKVERELGVGLTGITAEALARRLAKLSDE